ncbi:MAG: hypothetical protein DCC71_04605 [Proteobacteria bacterium]|nr:MAG: hypothetical protein DCC71_04605 [Pseudomonadota bacterium]
MTPALLGVVLETDLPALAQEALQWGAIPDLMRQLARLGAAAVSLPLATALGAMLAFRPRREGTPPRTPAVIQTQILLAVVGAIVMLVVGQSLARAFGIVGAASLIRYRAKVEDPKDAGVMLTTLGIGLASGVGLYLLATFATLFVLGVLWWVESLEPRATKRFRLRVVTKDPAALKPRLRPLLRRHGAEYELRSVGADELCFDVALPLDQRTDAVSTAILALAPDGGTEVEWEEKKK